MLYFILYNEDICNTDRRVDFALLNVTRQIEGGSSSWSCFCYSIYLYVIKCFWHGDKHGESVRTPRIKL